MACPRSRARSRTALRFLPAPPWRWASCCSCTHRRTCAGREPYAELRISRIIWSPILSGVEPRSHRHCRLHGDVELGIKSLRSERLEEREQVRLGLPRLGVCRLDPSMFPEGFQRIALHLQVRGDVAARRGHAGVTEIVADHGHVGARLQQRHRAAVAQYMRCDPLWRGDNQGERAASIRMRMRRRLAGGRRA